MVVFFFFLGGGGGGLQSLGNLFLGAISNVWQESLGHLILGASFGLLMDCRVFGGFRGSGAFRGLRGFTQRLQHA